MQTQSPEHAEAPDALESQAGAPVDDVHDHVPLSALVGVAKALSDHSDLDVDPKR